MTQIKAIVPVQVPTANSVAPRCKQRRLGKEDYDSLSHAELVTALVARDAELLDARSGKRKFVIFFCSNKSAVSGNNRISSAATSTRSSR